MKNILKCLFLICVILNASLLAVLTPDEEQLFYAVNKKDLNRVHDLIANKKVNPNILHKSIIPGYHEYIFPLLVHAIIREYSPIVDYLIEQACVDIEIKYNGNWIPLDWALLYGHFESSIKLLANHATIPPTYVIRYPQVREVMRYKEEVVIGKYKNLLAQKINSSSDFTVYQWLNLSLLNKYNQLVLYAIEYGHFKPQDVLDGLNHRKNLPLDIVLDLFGMLNKKQIKTFKKNVIENENFKMLALLKEYEFKKQMLSIGKTINIGPKNTENFDIKLFYKN